ncbi:TerC family protein [Pseudomonas sp. LS44]|uniref:TerC family protein n=1 Tax=Pseudomonas sp. LS44 TaxID=1357074 RepID=UPI00215AC1F8|nr:TerC family protein [Pseudomonas sp. LS44]UVE17938.1 TerC family protein [Pseudomonas sp. LS44]
MEWLSSPELWIAFLTLTVLEIVLGIDNIIMITLLAGRLPAHQQHRARMFGLALAMVTRIGLLLSITSVMRLTTDLFEVRGHGLSGRDLVLLVGGLFLLWKSSQEIYYHVEGLESDASEPRRRAGGLIGTVIQIALLDIVFSLDSVITAVGMVQHVPVMVAAIVAAVLVMMLAVGPVGDFINRHPSLQLLALSFLTLVGTVLIAEAFDVHVPRGYLYFAMAFSLGVEALNIRRSRSRSREKSPAADAKQEDISGP